jgi:hypothetical protein
MEAVRVLLNNEDQIKECTKPSWDPLASMEIHFKRIVLGIRTVSEGQSYLLTGDYVGSHGNALNSREPSCLW